jgi:hypothetical protein
VSCTWLCWCLGTYRETDKISDKHCISLARNKRVVSYTETDGEKIDLALKQWKEIASEAACLSRGDFLTKAKAAVGDSKLVTILGDPVFNNLLRTQQRTPVTWMLSPWWKITWLWNLLVSPSGGVRGMLSGAKHSILTPHPLC